MNRVYIVFDIVGKQVYFRTRSHHQIRTIDFTLLDFSSTAPTKMLKVQNNFEGDVTGLFYNYSHEESYAHNLAFFKAYINYIENAGPPDIQAFVRRTLQHLEGRSSPASK